jgi:hypothetical protein
MKRWVTLSLSKGVRKGLPAMVRQAHHDPPYQYVMGSRSEGDPAKGRRGNLIGQAAMLICSASSRLPHFVRNDNNGRIKDLLNPFSNAKNE